MKYAVVTNTICSFDDYERGDIAKIKFRDQFGIFVHWLEVRFPDNTRKERARCAYLTDDEFMEYNTLDEATAASEKERGT